MSASDTMVEPILLIDGEYASIEATDASPGRRPNGKLTSAGRKYEISIDGDPGWHLFPWLSSSIKESGKHSIGFDMFACADNENVPHRAEVALIDCLERAHPLAFGIRRFVGLSFYIDHLSDVPRNWTAIFQVWQFSRLSPPFELNLRMGNQGDPFTLEFKARNDKEPNHLFFERPVRQGTWYRLVFEFLPAYVGATFGGRICVWLSEVGVPIGEIPIATYQGPWGYAPGPTTRGKLPVKWTHAAFDLFDIRFGVYRRKQERRLKIFFDNIAYADGFAAAARPLKRARTVLQRYAAQVFEWWRTLGRQWL